MNYDELTYPKDFHPCEFSFLEQGDKFFVGTWFWTQPAENTSKQNFIEYKIYLS